MAGKAPRHRKKIRSARTAANAAPLGGVDQDQDANADAGDKGKKVGRKEAEVTNLLDKLRSAEVDERVWASVRAPCRVCRSRRADFLLSFDGIGRAERHAARPASGHAQAPPLAEPDRPPDRTPQRLVRQRGRRVPRRTPVRLLSQLILHPLWLTYSHLKICRNLAVTSPLSLISEMHNKRLLLPLTTSHLPLLSALLPSLLGPAPAPITAPLPSTPADRERAAEANEKVEHRRRLGWDWIENVVFLLWALAESNTKILASLNAVGVDLIVFLGQLVRGEREGEGDGGTKKGKKAAQAVKSVPVAVALAAGESTPFACTQN